MEEENNEQSKKNRVILLTVIILAIIIVVLVVFIPRKKSNDKVAVDSNKVIQIEDKDTEKKDNEENTNKEIKFSKNSVILSVGGSETLNILNNNSKDLAWSSSHPNIATVNNSGVVTAVSMGTSVITGQKSDGSTGSCTIIVKGTSSSGNKNAEDVPNDTTDIDQNYTPNIPDNTQNSDWDLNNDDINNEQPDVPIIDEPILDSIKHIVTFMMDNQIVLTQEVENGLPINNIPQNPNKYGYTFKGWYNGEQEITANTVITENMTVIGKWDEYSFKLDLIGNDISSPNRIVKAYKNGEDININTLFGNYNGKEDYRLATWNPLLSNIRCVSYRQVRSATNYKIQLTSGMLVFANEK